MTQSLWLEGWVALLSANGTLSLDRAMIVWVYISQAVICLHSG